MLSTFFNALTKFIGILAIINEIVDPLSDKIVENFPFITEIAYLRPLLLYGATIFLLAIYTHYTIKEKSIDIKYRIVKNPSDFDLKIGDIESDYGAKIDFAVEMENVEGRWIKLFSWLNFNILVQVNHPYGIKINMERIKSDFKVIEPKETQKMEMCAPLLLDGRRKFSIYLELDDNTSYGGKGFIDTKIYITPKRTIFGKIFSIELGMSKIYILPS